MAKKMLIDATHAEETRVVVIDGTKVEEFDFETLSKRQISGNIYLAKVTRVEPSLQAAFVDYGGNRHGFLAFSEIHPDYYQIPAADRAALIAEEQAHADAQEDEDNRREKARRGSKASAAKHDDESVSDPAPSAEDEADAASSNDGAHDPHEDAAAADDGIESVGDEDIGEDIRPQRKARPRRYKIQEVVRVRQIMLVQVVKEERGNKGAALTTYLSLAGRYCVLMPNTARGGGISRKITNAADRKKLKDIAGELNVPQGAGLIVRTAGSQRTRSEIRRDYEYLLRLWERIREVTFKSIAPAAIYEEGDLIKRSIRDLYGKEIDEVLVEGERGYRVAKDFMKMIMPSHAKNVKHYADSMPLFGRFQVESYLTAMFNPVVQLKSGGYIVIGVTEALVAIDVNSGRATKEGSIEETALKTNLEAADEVARHLRLRDLAGLIVIDFIDMDERKNNAAVEKRLKDRLKSDRARIQVGKISGFGLMEMSRQRLRPGMLESTTQPCPHCHGTGLIRSDDSLALTILRAIEEEGTRKRSREVLVRAPVAVVNFLINVKREHIAGIELRYGLSVRVEADPSLISPDFVLEKLKTTTRAAPEAAQIALSVNSELMASVDEDTRQEDEDETTSGSEAVASVAPAGSDDSDGDNDSSNRRRRRRRRRKKNPDSHDGDLSAQDTTVRQGQPKAQESSDAEPAKGQDMLDTPGAVHELSGDAASVAEAEPASEVKKAPGKRSRSKKTASDKPAAAELPEVVDLRDSSDSGARVDAFPDDAPKPKSRRRSRKATASADESAVTANESNVIEAREATAPAAAPEQAPALQSVAEETLPPAEPVAVATPEAAASDDLTAMAEVEQSSSAPPAAAVEPEVAEDAAARPKRRGWWSAGK